MDDATSRPSQKRRDNKSDALAGSGRREAQHMLRSIMPQILSLDTPEDHAVCPGEAGTSNLKLARPTCRTICGRCLRLPSPPYRHRKCDYDRDDPARRSDACAFDEHFWRIGIVGIPPPEEGRRKIDGNARRELKPGVTELGLIAEPPRRPLRRGPRRDQYDGQDAGDLAPKYSGCGHGMEYRDDSVIRRQAILQAASIFGYPGEQIGAANQIPATI